MGTQGAFLEEAGEHRQPCGKAPPPTAWPMEGGGEDGVCVLTLTLERPGRRASVHHPWGASDPTPLPSREESMLGWMGTPAAEPAGTHRLEPRPRSTRSSQALARRRLVSEKQTVCGR